MCVHVFVFVAYRAYIGGTSAPQGSSVCVCVCVCVCACLCVTWPYLQHANDCVRPIECEYRHKGHTRRAPTARRQVLALLGCYIVYETRTLTGNNLRDTHTHTHTHTHTVLPVLTCEPGTGELPVCMLCKADRNTHTCTHGGYCNDHT